MMLGKDSKETIDPVDAFAAKVLLDSAVNIKAMLRGISFGPEILKCLNDKISFGLSNGEGSWLVFNVPNNLIYDYSYGQFAIFNAGSYHKLLVYLKVSLNSHREFRTSEMCVQFLRDKNLII